MKRLRRLRSVPVVEKLAIDCQKMTVSYKVKPLAEVRKGGNVIIRKVDNKGKK